MADIINRRPSAIAAAALATAMTQMGVTEVPLGSNNGPEVRKYLKSIGLGPGYAWCMAFVYWCVNEAAMAAKMENPLVRTGGVMAQLNQVKGKTVKIFKEINVNDLRPGDIFIMSFSGGLGHTGFIERVSGDTVFTIEGNTDQGGSREGVGVFQKRRKISLFKAVIRITD